MDIYKLELTPEEEKDLSKDIREALHENYILKAKGETDEDCMVHDILVAFTWQLRRTLSKFIPDAKREAELRALLIKTFAQTVEYGAMCSECCSSQGEGAKVICEMSNNPYPMNPDDYCPQQIACIENVLPQVLSLFGERAQ